MDKNTDILHEAKRLRLLAAVLELQHYTSTASNIVPIPGGDRVIAIGTPAQVRALLGAASSEIANSEHAINGSELAFVNDGREPDWNAYAAAEACADMSEGGHHD